MAPVELLTIKRTDAIAPKSLELAVVPKINHKTDEQKHTKGPHWVIEATKARCGNRGSPSQYLKRIRRDFFSVQRLHGFRQVVTHVQSQQKDEL